MKKLFYLYLLSVLGLIWFSGCSIDDDENCSGSLPAFTEEEFSWIPGKSADNKLTFISSRTGEAKVYYELHDGLHTHHEGHLSSPNPCPSALTITQDYYLSDSPYFRLPADHSQTFMYIQLKKSHEKGFSTAFYWKQLNGERNFNQFPEQLSELTVRGSNYQQVYVYTNDITHANDFEGPTTHKLYFAKDFGVIKWENADGEVWERQ